MNNSPTKATILYNPNVKKSSTTVLSKSSAKTSNFNGTKQIDPNDELPKQTTVGRETGLKIQKARLAKNFTQRQISNTMNMDNALYQKYENGTAVRNGQILNRLSKVLGVKFNFKNI